MKTMFICAESRVDRHEGEYYDDIVEVPDQPTSDIIQGYADDIRGRLRSLWKSDVDDETKEGEPSVVVYLDALHVFTAMLIDFKIVMEDAEKMKIELPGVEMPSDNTKDPETQEVLKKLDRGGI